MEKMMIDLTGCTTRRDVYDRLRQPLKLPIWFGCNADALFDEIDSRVEKGAVCFTSCPDEQQVYSTVMLCQRVLEDCGWECSLEGMFTDE